MELTIAERLQERLDKAGDADMVVVPRRELKLLLMMYDEQKEALWKRIDEEKKRRAEDEERKGKSNIRLLGGKDDAEI